MIGKVLLIKCKLIILGVLLSISLNIFSKDYFYPNATYYHAHPGAITASGSRIKKNESRKWIAISKDYIENKIFNYGDTVIIESAYCPKLNGEWIVMDLMNKKWRNKIDFLIQKTDIVRLEFYKPHKVRMRRKKKE